jgi:predicted alpha/beta superfamily hydrolase
VVRLTFDRGDDFVAGAAIMSNRRWLALSFVLLLQAAAASAQEPTAARYPRVTIPDTEVRTVRSAIVDENFQISIALPRGYTSSDARYPVLYVTDADVLFAAVTQVVRLMQLQQELPPMLLVGIGYGVEEIGEWRTRRRRDFTPTRLSGEPERRSGGAADFLRFIREELMPFVEENYRTSSDNALAGGSFGALFALYALFHAPHVFQRHIVVSPSIWWDDRATLDYEAEYAATHSDLPVTIFMSVGGLEERPGSGSRMVSNAKHLANSLRARNYPGLDLEMFVFDDETHVSGVAGAISRGLRVVYGDLVSH